MFNIKLQICILLTSFLSSNYVICQTKCPQNGIQTNEGACFYLSSDTCPDASKEEGIPQNDVELVVIRDLLRKSKSRDRICMSITDSDLNSVIDHQPYYMRKLREEKKMLLSKPIEDEDALHTVFKIKNPALNSILTIGQGAITVCQISIFNGQFKLSTSNDAEIVMSTFEPNSDSHYDIVIRFLRGVIQVLDNVKLVIKVKIDLSINLDYLADMISIENIEVIQLEYHNLKCQNGEAYRNNTPTLLRDFRSSLSNRSFERSLIQNFNLHTENGSKNLQLPRRNDWAENFTFHLLGEQNSRKLNFEIRFKAMAEDKQLEYSCNLGHLYVNYQKRSRAIFGYFYYKYIIGTNYQLPPSTSEFTISMVQEEDRKLKIALETDSWVKSETISHPCEGQRECPFTKDETLIKTSSSYISGFRYLEKQHISTYCSSDHWIPEFTPQVFYRDDCSAEKPLNLCRIKVPMNTKPQNVISSEEKVETSEQKDTFVEPSMNFAKPREYDHWEILKGNRGVFVTSCLFLTLSLLLSLINSVVEYLNRPCWK